MRRTFIAATLAFVFALSGCSRPAMPTLTGPGKFRDISAVRKGMSPNEVQRVMGRNFKAVFEEGIEGMDGGNRIWEYPEGRVYFDMEGVTRVQAFDSGR